MKLNYQNDILKYVSEKQLEKRESIVKKWNEVGTISRTNGMFLLDFDKKTRVCNCCGKSFKESKGWTFATALDRYGNEVPCGLATNCFDCEMREIIRDGMLGRL
jgi:hypothetical protein